MKTMKCNQLGGACNLEFKAETFGEMVTLSKNHGAEMFEKKDSPHLKAMDDMMKLMESPKDLMAWFEGKRKEFENLPADS